MTRLRETVRETDAGVTLVELLAVMSIMAVIFGITAAGLTGWSRSRELSGSADELVSFLRNAQQRAVTEQVTYCVTLESDNRSWSLRKFGCTDPVVRGPLDTQTGGVTLTGGAFTQPDGTVNKNVAFLPRGSASDGSVVVRRGASTTGYTVSVEGLTARVSVTH